MLEAKKNRFFFTTSFSKIEPSFINIPPGAYELERLIAETKRICINKGHFREKRLTFQNKTHFFSSLGSIKAIDVETGRQNVFNPDVSIRDLLGLKHVVSHDEYNLCDFPVDILSFDNILLECDIAQGMIFKGKRSGILHNFTMDVDPRYKCVENFRGGVQWYMTESKDFISSINFKIKNENNELLSFSGQRITFPLSI